jgi:PPOX class probable FMN-dependent enzyme
MVAAGCARRYPQATGHGKELRLKGNAALRALSAEEVRSVIGDPHELVVLKVRAELDEHCRAFIAHSPFVALATIDADGHADVSPRGDPPGFVKVLDETTLAIPERPGNKLMDSLANILETCSVALLFVIPGIEETLRVNGKATITDEPELLATMEVEGKPPRLAIVVQVEEAYLHCAKAFKRSRLWDPSAQLERAALPSLGQMLRDQIRPKDRTAADIDAYAEEDYRTRLY